MSLRIIGIVLVAMLASKTVVSQTPWQEFETGTNASLRGLVAIDAECAWACGSRGTVLVTKDGGKQWEIASPPGYDAVEIRSIFAWSDTEAIVATAGQPAVILKTWNSGKGWNEVYRNTSSQAFLDGMRFSNTKNGIAFSDPIDGNLLILRTMDGGHTWTEVSAENVPRIDTGEAGFAASNSSLCIFGKQAWIGLGGSDGGAARLFTSSNQGMSWTASKVLPINRGASSGIFSICFENSNKGVAVGGDYKKEKDTENNVAVTNDGGITWHRSTKTPPSGYRSCVAFMSRGNDKKWIAVGPSGTDESLDGEDWQRISDIGFHTLAVARDGSVWAAGSKGRVAKH